MELHLHLDGAVRLSTIRQLALAKKIALTPHNTEQEIANATSVAVPSTLAYFLSKMAVYLPLLVGDRVAIERIAYELCQDQAAQQVAYFEARFSPHLLSNTVAHFFNAQPVSIDSPQAVTPREVIKLVARGLHRGEHDFGLAGARLILCTIKGHAGWSTEVVQMAAEIADEGVVGIDIAGDESSGYTQEETSAFKRAKELGIHRTVHAGESGPASNVAYAIDKLYAERIGHGYRVLEDRRLYDRCRSLGIHFETCPYSSLLTGAVKLSILKESNQRHPIVSFAEDEVNFSINKDDPTVTKSSLDSEYSFLWQMGLREVDFIRAVSGGFSQRSFLHHFPITF